MRETMISWVNDIFGSGLFSAVESILNWNPSSGDFRTAWNIICNIYENICVPIGMGLVLIYFMVNVIEKSTQQQSIDVEHIIKLLLKLFIGLYLIEHGLEIMASIYSLSFGFVKGIAGLQGNASGGAGTEAAAAAWKSLTGEDINANIKWGAWDFVSKVLPLCLQLLLPWLVTFIMRIVVYFVCYTRLIEFYLKTAAAPIALSDFFTEGIHSNGWKFVKGYIATALQGGIIMLAVVVYNGLASHIFGGSWAELITGEYGLFVIKYLALGIATIGVMLKSLSLAKELVGVN